MTPGLRASPTESATAAPESMHVPSMHDVIKALPVIPPEPSLANPSTAGAGTEFHGSCPRQGIAVTFAPCPAVPAASSTECFYISSTAMHCARTNMAPTKASIASPCRWGAAIQPASSTIPLFMGSGALLKPGAEMPFTSSVGVISRHLTVVPYTTSTAAVPVTRRRVFGDMGRESVCATSPRLCEHYAVGDTVGIPFEKIVAYSLQPGLYLTEDEEYLADVPGTNPGEVLTKCILNGAQPSVSFAAGRGSRRVEVVVPGWAGTEEIICGRKECF